MHAGMLSPANQRKACWGFLLARRGRRLAGPVGVCVWSVPRAGMGRSSNIVRGRPASAAGLIFSMTVFLGEWSLGSFVAALLFQASKRQAWMYE